MRAVFLALSLRCTVGAVEGPALLRQLDAAFAEVFAKAAPSVVVIKAVKADEEEDGPPLAGEGEQEKKWPPLEGPAFSEGSGFIFRPDGHILTNLHVVAGAREIEVRTYDGRRFAGALLAEDAATDIAVLKVEADGLSAAAFGDSDAVRVGQLVCAIGAPYNQDFSFTCGWVSGTGRSDLLQKASARPIFEDYIQTDAFINPGNSGGPLLDVEGRVVGMNTLINGLGRGLAFAIPANQLRRAADQLIEHGRVRRPWIGVSVTSLQENKEVRAQFPGVEQGVVVVTVVAGGPAIAGDLLPGDLIAAVDGVPLRTRHDLVRQVQRRGVGEALRLDLVRAGKPHTITLITGEQPEDPRRAAIPQPAPRPDVAPDFGLELTDATPTGAKIITISPESPAARADLRPADVIIAVNTEPVATAEAARSAIFFAMEKAPHKGVLLNFLRDGKKSWGVIERPHR
jgi:S1-C subfamily serine protease